jgi:hypothetical protein
MKNSRDENKAQEFIDLLIETFTLDRDAIRHNLPYAEDQSHQRGKLERAQHALDIVKMYGGWFKLRITPLHRGGLKLVVDNDRKPEEQREAAEK